MVGTDYINVGQDTLYYKKFDYVGTPYTHQYMTHIRAPELESAKTAKAYSQELKSGSPIVFKIPVFKNMPESAAAMPTGDGNPNNCLASLSINNYSLTPTFSKFTTSYSLIVDKSVTSVNINASAIVSSTKVTGTGKYDLKEGSNTIKVVATAQNGSARTYTITIVRQDKPAGGGTTNPGGSGGTVNPSFTINTTLNKNSNNTITGITPGASVADVAATVTVSGGSFDILDANKKVKKDGKICTGDMIAVKDASGNYVSYYPTVVYGDVNGDGEVTIKDLLILRKYILGTASLNDSYLQAGNANKDENGVTIKDILVLRKQLLGTGKIDQK